MKVYIEPDELFYPEIKYVFSLFARHINLTFSFCESSSNSDLLITSNNDADLRVSRSFYLRLRDNKFDHKYHFINECLVEDSEGFVDYLSSAFYMLALIQEVDNNDTDEFGRFKYASSYQHKYSNSDKNLVSEIFEKIREGSLKFKGSSYVKPSVVFLSHDIDTIYGSLLQDSFYCLKRGDFLKLIQVLISNVFSGPSWFNIDLIRKLESQHDFYSTFYWLVRQGKVDARLNNSDYSFSRKFIQTKIAEIEESKLWENGLHKSAGDADFTSEMQEFGHNVIGNRYHYLKFNSHQDFELVERAGLKIDASLGFADSVGFRNSYGSPYYPYFLRERRPFSFIEVPLHLMDTTFHHYLKTDGNQFAESVISFFEKNNVNCVIGLLTHNNYYSEFKYGDYFKAIRKILTYLYESKIKSISQTEILNQYS